MADGQTPPLTRIFHGGWPESGSRPAMARRGVKVTGAHRRAIVSGPFVPQQSQGQRSQGAAYGRITIILHEIPSARQEPP
uniref:Uncharacterized protein n=1 Tax=Magnetococcus massalia (strain MO-1) TaxID=451514 RepID=A0A1S7LNH6_MAGMO|nr:protein of unknown function [Candidatus Magnetococcus massalia]